MTPIPTISLADAMGKTLQASCLKEGRLTLLWTDQTATTLRSSSSYGDPYIEDDDAGTTLDNILFDTERTPMSMIPGYELENYLMYRHDLIVDGDTSGNMSLALAEAMGTPGRQRTRLTGAQFAPIVARYEPWRERIEQQLEDYDDETTSWRDYAGYAFDFIPEMDLSTLIQKGTR